MNLRRCAVHDNAEILRLTAAIFGPRLPARAGHRQRKIERQRRRDCDRSPAWLQRRPPGHDADPPDGSHRRLARHRVALRRGRTRPGDGLRTGVSLEMGLTIRSFKRPARIRVKHRARIEYGSAHPKIHRLTLFRFLSSATASVGGGRFAVTKQSETNTLSRRMLPANSRLI